MNILAILPPVSKNINEETKAFSSIEQINSSLGRSK